MEFLYTVKGIPSDMVEFSTLDDKLIMEFLSWLETERSQFTLMLAVLLE